MYKNNHFATKHAIKVNINRGRGVHEGEARTGEYFTQ